MYQELYQYALLHGISHKKNRRMCKIAAHIVLDENGKFDSIISHGKMKERKETMVPDVGTLKFNANTDIICEKTEYIISGVIDDKGKPVGNEKKHHAWVSIMEEGSQHDENLKTIYQFLEEMEQDKGLKEDVYRQLRELKVGRGEFISFHIIGKGDVEKLTSWEQWFDNWVESRQTDNKNIGISCITGEKVNLVTKQPFPRITSRMAKTGSYLASFNTEVPALTSYGIMGNAGTPMSSDEAAIIADGLQHLLNSENNHDDIFGVVYWYQDDNAQNLIGHMLNGKLTEDDEACIRKLRKTAGKNDKSYTAQRTAFTSKGAYKHESLYDDKTYNLMSFKVTAKGRHMVSNSTQDTYGNLADCIHRWMEDTSIVCPVYKDKELTGVAVKSIKKMYEVLFKLLDKKDAKDLFKQIQAEYGHNVKFGLLQAMLLNRQIPKEFYDRALRQLTNTMLRGTTDNKGQNFGTSLHLRIIKLYLLRSGREEYKCMEKELNTSVKSSAYHMGRYLAVAESLQRAALGKSLTRTIATNFYKTLKTMPARIGMVQEMAVRAYLPKLRSVGREDVANYYEGRLNEIRTNIGDIPYKLNIYEAGAYDLGYAQQKTELKKEYLERKNNGTKKSEPKQDEITEE